MKGILCLSENGHQSYEIFEADQSFIFQIATILTNVFEYKSKILLDCFEGYYLDLYKEKIKLTVGWDNWSGCFIMSYCNEGDKEIVTIQEYLDEYLSHIS